ncbi:MAG: hypothetical protein LBJ31_07770 [Treponema sp.]|jgi:hypothetical protein|nr:hypothetical protein [Treponema sp.]
MTWGNLKTYTMLLSNSVLLLFLFSCNSGNISLDWHILSTYSWENIEIDFLNNTTHERITVVLEPNKTKQFKLPNNCSYSGYGGDAYIRFYPDLELLNTGTPLSIYLYYPEIIETNDNEFIIDETNEAYAYFADFLKDGKRYTAFSPDNVIKPEREISINFIDVMMNELANSGDVYFYDEFATTVKLHRYGDMVICGFIVKSPLDGSFIWLEPQIF